MKNCPKCKSWWELCPKHEEIERRKAEFMEKLKRAMKNRSPVSFYGDTGYYGIPFVVDKKK